MERNVSVIISTYNNHNGDLNQNIIGVVLSLISKEYNDLVNKYIYGTHGDVHVINLTSTIFLLKKLLNDLVSIFSENNARLLFVGSKEQLEDIIKNSAERCGQYYVNQRWFGGTMTNWQTIQRSIRKMNEIEKQLENDTLSKKDKLNKLRVLATLNKSLGGIRKMSHLPDLIFVTDTNREKVAIAEAKKLGIPVIALIDSNSNPTGVDYPIPCNDDSQKSVSLICQLISDAVLTGIEIAFEKRQAQKRERDAQRKSFSDRKNYVQKEEKKEEGVNESAENVVKEEKKPMFNKDAQASSASGASATPIKKSGPRKDMVTGRKPKQDRRDERN
jgi:small subunit ribosomal protein S2